MPTMPTVSPNAHRNCRLLRKIPRSNSALQAAKLSLQAGGENVQLSMDPEDCKQLFSKVRWKKVFDANGKITRFRSSERTRHSAPLTTFKNLASPKLAIVKGDFPVSEQQEEEKRTFSKLRCRLYSCLSSHQALMPLQLFIKSKLPFYLFCLLDDQLPDAPPVVYQTKCWQDYPPSRFASQSQSSIWFMHQPALGKEDHFDRCNVKMDKVININFNLSVFLEALASLDFTHK